MGLAGNADVIVASEDAYFGLPEVDRGALGAATHLSRLVPQHKMRAMVYTSTTATAAELHAFGSVWNVVPRDDLDAAADVKRSYRFEQGFTFELNLSGVADEHRDAFVAKGGAGTSAPGTNTTSGERPL